VFRACIAASFVLIAWGCATSEQVRDAGAGPEYRISCSYFGWYICYDRANELCPGRYKVIAENEGLHGRELRISCPS
jgi:hypothetical protein